MESSAKHFFHMSKIITGRKWDGGFNSELTNRMVPIPADEMLTVGEDFALREFTCKESIEQYEAFYRLPFESRNQAYSSGTSSMIGSIKAESGHFAALDPRRRYTMHSDSYS